MTDLIGYVVSELKGKRLAKADALSLLGELMQRTSRGSAAAIIHPLLHVNSSDLGEQRYSSTFTGAEFFLSDHQVVMEGEEGSRKVLPGVAYLEMARAALEHALPDRPRAKVLELHNTVWAQPLVVRQSAAVSIALGTQDGERIDYEIYSDGAGEEVVHCRGQARLGSAPTHARLDVRQLEQEMGGGRLTGEEVYQRLKRMGYAYGPAHQAITQIDRGERQLLARLRVPEGLSLSFSQFVLHPSVLDGALQASIGLLDETDAHGARVRLPYALDRLTILAGCAEQMFAWVRYAPHDTASDELIKLDVDLCDEQGNVCAQLRGLSIRALGKRIAEAPGTLLALPVWQSKSANAAERLPEEPAERHVLLCELPQIDARELERLLPGSRCRVLQAQAGQEIGQHYRDHAAECLWQVQAILRSQPRARVLVQLVMGNSPRQALHAGLSGLLRSAALENPRVSGQVLLIDADASTERLAQVLRQDGAQLEDRLIRYDDGARRVLSWQKVQAPSHAPCVFKEQGVYLISGGLGGLGRLFAREILQRTAKAKVIVTGRSAASVERQALLDELDGGERLVYCTVDLTDRHALAALIERIGAEHGQLNGILHCAGATADSFIVKKSASDLGAVLAPKVLGTVHLDLASAAIELDFFVLFSSIAAAFGNVGQADYAAANGFMDEFAAYRNRLVTAGERHGRTVSINWPLWQSGGMEIDVARQEQLTRSTGLQPLSTARGLQTLHEALALGCDRLLVLEGESQRLHALLGTDGIAVPAIAPRDTSDSLPPPESQALQEKTEEYLRKQLATVLRMPAQKIDPQAPLERYGIDSILAMRLTDRLEQTFGSLSKTLFFEHQSIRALTRHFVSAHQDALVTLFRTTPRDVPGTAPQMRDDVAPDVSEGRARRRRSSSRLRREKDNASEPGAAPVHDEPIAIIGLSGRYPGARNLDEYWENLRTGKDCISEVPKERWDWREYFSEDRTRGGHHYSKWGGFISGVDEFDPLFFNIAPLEAERLDPQERLFLQHAWMTMEDAGYTRASLAEGEGDVGVYVGVMYSEYQLFGAEASLRGERTGIAGSVASIANRVSYVLDLHGPSMTLDTMCSSSLTAIHIACQDLRSGRTRLAFAGGVNVSVHPNKYLVLSAGQFISSEGHCRSFGEGGEGYIPGEGVGVVLLKRLSEAQRDGDHVYGVIRGSALTHGGKTNGYTVPNPTAQSAAIVRALSAAGVPARHISYLEAHGTGTKLGDPIEIAALSQAFARQTAERGFCLLGSVKSNIGHCESAAGIAGLTKVLLQFQHRQIAPSLHSERLNPHIDFHKTPFVVNQTLTAWEAPVVEGRRVPRIAGISSFGAGGSNAHVVVEEYEAAFETAVPVATGPVPLVLSARTSQQLEQKARDLLELLRTSADLQLVDLAYTLQVGRESMEERLGLIVDSLPMLGERLQSYLAGVPDIEDLYRGQARRERGTLALFDDDPQLQHALGQWMSARKYGRLLELWVNGVALDWRRLYDADRLPRRISLPTYPFAQERYWIDTHAGGRQARGAAVLHPLLHTNTSDLLQQRYRTTFDGTEPFLRDHQVRMSEVEAPYKVLPAAAYLEMARAALAQALPNREQGAVLELHDTVWAQPLVVSETKSVSIALHAHDEERIDYEIYSEHGEEEVVHCRGQMRRDAQGLQQPFDVRQLGSDMQGQPLDAEELYERLGRMGLVYGPAHRTIVAIHRAEGQLLARLRVPEALSSSLSQYVLHPSVLDGALQASIGLLDEAGGGVYLPFALDRVSIVAGCAERMLAWVRYAPGRGESSLIKLDVDLCDEQGRICAQLRGLTIRALSQQLKTTGNAATVLAAPVWRPQEPDVAGDGHAEFIERHVLICDLPEVDTTSLARLLPGSRCSVLQDQPGQDIAQRYVDRATECLWRLQQIVRSQPRGPVLVQWVLKNTQEHALLAGLSGLLMSASQENPLVHGQIVLIEPALSSDEIARRLERESLRPQDRSIRYEAGVRQVLGWEELRAPAAVPCAFKERGIYLITGGLGGLGRAFARDILERAKRSHVIVTGRSALSAERRALLDALGPEERVSYRAVDLTDRLGVHELIAQLVSEHGALNGIIHCAGARADGFIMKKSASELAAVLGPKVPGTVNLDLASAGLELDFFALFSSIAAAFGNVGQGDYAAANGFMDEFATYRNGLVAAGERRGLTVSIDWPLWESGGMQLDEAAQARLRRTTGLSAMRTATGLEVFQQALALRSGRLLVLEGQRERLRALLSAGGAPPAAVEPVAETGRAVPLAAARLQEKTEDYLRGQLSEVLKVPVHKIDVQAPLERYGIDSILAMRLTEQLERTFGSLSKTLFFEYQSIAALAGYFSSTHAHTVRAHIDAAEASAPPAQAAPVALQAPAPSMRRPGRFVAPAAAVEEVAIVGLAGRYPLAEDLDEFWDNLLNGRDCITEIPPERWEAARYYHPDRDTPGATYSKWGGFLRGVDAFDPMFFNISPREAELLDPQERLFLEIVWQTLEDAGCTRESLASRRVGVYVGVMWGHYELLGVESLSNGGTAVPNSSYASIANRVSYFFDFHGPSLALDTMCSSSLTAIHLASEAVRRGEVDAAIAGGVNLSLHPQKYLNLSQGRFVASDGRCRSFGAGGDGYVPGEGVGAVLLKPLSRAIEDGDRIYAVIRSSGINHGGKTNGYTVPNPVAQGELIRQTLAKAKIEPHTLGYIETHGTGTALGDPIEIAGLLRAFEGRARQSASCPIGSVKSNIGHLESAAGIAALTKVLLQLEHEQIVPSLHATPPNPNIRFEDSPFHVQTTLSSWPRGAAHPRRAAVSSFGAGGANAHLVVEEPPHVHVLAVEPGAREFEICVLSARDRAALRRHAERMARFCARTQAALSEIAYTLQVGRSAMKARLVVIASTPRELGEKLEEWLRFEAEEKSGAAASREPLQAVFSGHVDQAVGDAGVLIEGAAGKDFVARLMAERDLAKLARLWVLGLNIDWALLRGGRRPRKVSLPGYPFEKQRCWIEVGDSSARHLVPPPRAAEDVRKVTQQNRSAYFAPLWQATALGRSADDLPTGPVLILETSEHDPLTRALSERLARDPERHPIVRVLLGGPSLREIEPDVFTLDPRSEEAFIELVEELERRRRLPRIVLHRCSRSSSLHEEAQLAQQLGTGIFALQTLCKTLLRRRHTGPLRVLSMLTGGAHAPENAALGAFLKTLTLENPDYAAKLVDLAYESDDASVCAALVMNELLEADWRHAEVRYVPAADPARFERRTRVLAPCTIETSHREVPLAQSGVYVITGGLGGLGFIFGEYLARKVRAKLVLAGRSALGEEQQRKLDALQAAGAEVLYVQADVAFPTQAAALMREARARFGRVNGVIHAAGMNRDALIRNKTPDDLSAVLNAKVAGTVALDLATAEDALDLFVLFSSVAGALGNPGQADYAYANAFLDEFSSYREALRAAGARRGRTLSIGWPYWQDGGMALAQAQIEAAAARSGLYPLPTAEGLRCWEELACSTHTRAVILYGEPSKIAAAVGSSAPARSTRPAVLAEGGDSSSLLERTQAHLTQLVSRETKLDPDRIDVRERFEAFGFDSVMIGRLTAALEQQLGDLPKSLLYEHETIEELAGYLVRTAEPALRGLLGGERSEMERDAVPANAQVGAGHAISVREAEPHIEARRADRAAETFDVAIIGAHGAFPHAATFDDLWQHLKQGRDLVGLVPSERWDWTSLYDPDPEAAARGKIYCKWGAFLEDCDKFDAPFFNIAAEEARNMDPQERLFLQSVWGAIEDAGYTRERLRKQFPRGRSADVGVFVGVTTLSYHLLGPPECSRGNGVAPSAMPWSIANRVSYCFDFRGPSMPVDTACSGSLVAVHLACESLRKHECSVAVAGGVNLYLHPAKYHSLCSRRMLAREGRCRSYGAGDDGFVPGEGVGALVLKPLAAALADGDHIHAVIRGSAVEHNGRSNGYSAPNPGAQAELIRRALRCANVEPTTLSYVEGHGTGTLIGDSLEIAALRQAFGDGTPADGHCAVGSVKSNLGHAEAAAGIASIVKVILQMKHRQLVPTLHSQAVNPEIELEGTSFRLQHEAAPWISPAHPRRALINAFGAGGVNACVVLEEHERDASVTEAAGVPRLFVLSARSEERLKEYAASFVRFLLAEPHVDLASLCYTLQVGREAMGERLALVISSTVELVARLQAWIDGASAFDGYRGTASPGRKRATSISVDDFVRTDEQALSQLARRWVAGEMADWDALYAAARPHTVALPTYPFSGERYWVEGASSVERSTLAAEREEALHPLVTYNASSLREVCFGSRLSDAAYYAVDHRVRDTRVFPGVGFLEIACIAGTFAAEDKVRSIRDVVWLRPLTFAAGPRTLRTYLKRIGDGVEYTVASLEADDERVVHCEGRLFFASHPGEMPAVEETFSIRALKERAERVESQPELYARFARQGLYYGTAFQTVKELHVGSFALARLELPLHLRAELERYILHPSLIDGAMQTLVGLARTLAPGTPHLPFALEELSLSRPLPPVCYAYAEVAEADGHSRTDLRKFHVRLLDERGQTLLGMRNLYVRALELAPAGEGEALGR